MTCRKTSRAKQQPSSQLASGKQNGKNEPLNMTSLRMARIMFFHYFSPMYQRFEVFPEQEDYYFVVYQL